MALTRASHRPRPGVPAERAGPGPAGGTAGQLLHHPLVRALLEELPGYAVLLTPQHGLVAAAGDTLEVLGLAGPGQLLGVRPGELFRCVPMRDGRTCSRQFWVSRTALCLDGQDLLLFLFRETTAQKRREALEQVFLHDLLNLVGGLEPPAEPLEPAAATARMAELSRQLTDQIHTQRILLSAEAGRLIAARRPVLPRDVLERLEASFTGSARASRKRLAFLDGPGEAFECDPVLLDRVLVNLVKNALEATPEGGCVRVWHERRDGRIGFLVENPGLIGAEVAGRIFERCFSTKAEWGRGLGAYGAKLLGEVFLGGEVGFAAQDGERTRFFIWMPDGRSDPGLEAAAEPAQPHCPPLDGADTLLVVDDSRTLCRLMGDLLCPRYRVLTAENGREGFALAVQCRPDLILLDMRMPDMDGVEVCRRLKQDFRTREIPVLFLTALGGEADEMRALEAGGIDFLQKPVNPPLLAARIRNQLELKHRQDRLRNLSLLDGLTGIANRRRFDQYLEQEWQRCGRSGQPLSLVMGDVDFFKAYNDGYGHGRGDACLRSVAQVFGRALRRPADLAARYGGEEFVCVLPDTDPDGARIVADQVLAQMADLALPHAYSPVSGRVTVSVGLATAVRPASGRSWRGLVEEADLWLYQAKARGRNRIAGPGPEAACPGGPESCPGRGG